MNEIEELIDSLRKEKTFIFKMKGRIVNGIIGIGGIVDYEINTNMGMLTFEFSNRANIILFLEKIKDIK